MDLLKFTSSITEIISYFENHALLEWVKTEDKINVFDKEVITTKTIKQYKGIYFCFYSNRIDIIFKPHYYFNNNLHNANDFKAIDCIEVMKAFKKVFKINLDQLKVVNIEFGINVLSPIDVKKLVTYLQYHERNEFKTDVGLSYSKKSSKTNSKGLMSLHKLIKAYAKGLQFPEYCNINTFRFEVKSKKSAYINTLGIYTANDILNPLVYDRLGDEIMKEWSKVLILDCVTDFSSLKQSEQNKIKDYLNTLTWFENSQDNYCNRFNRERKKYYDLINKVDQNLKKQLDKIIFDKIEFLKSGYTFQSKSNITAEVQKSKSGYTFQGKSNITAEVQKSKSGYSSHIYKGKRVTTFDNSITIYVKDDRQIKKVKKEVVEVKQKDWSYQNQKDVIIEHNKLAALNYNNRNEVPF